MYVCKKERVASDALDEDDGAEKAGALERDTLVFVRDTRERARRHKSLTEAAGRTAQGGGVPGLNLFAAQRTSCVWLQMSWTRRTRSAPATHTSLPARTLASPLAFFSLVPRLLPASALIPLLIQPLALAAQPAMHAPPTCLLSYKNPNI